MNTMGEGHPDQEAEFPGLFKRYFLVYFSPDLLFRALRGRPDWLGAVLLGGALIAVGTLLLPADVTIATLRERSLAQGQPLPSGFEDLGGVLRYVGGAAAFVFWPIAMALYAGVVMVIFAFLLGHEGAYRQYLAVVAHAHLITATAGILIAPLRIAMEDAQLLISIGTFATFLPPGYVLRFLSFVDLFGVWSWVLVGLGAARIARKKSWSVGCVFVLMIPLTTAAVIAIFTG